MLSLNENLIQRVILIGNLQKIPNIKEKLIIYKQNFREIRLKLRPLFATFLDLHRDGSSVNNSKKYAIQIHTYQSLCFGCKP